MTDARSVKVTQTCTWCAKIHGDSSCSYSWVKKSIPRTNTAPHLLTTTSWCPTSLLMISQTSIPMSPCRVCLILHCLTHSVFVLSLLYFFLEKLRSSVQQVSFPFSLLTFTLSAPLLSPPPFLSPSNLSVSDSGGFTGTLAFLSFSLGTRILETFIFFQQFFLPNSAPCSHLGSLSN